MVLAAMNFIELDEQFNTGFDRQVGKMMLYQVMEYIMKWTYKDDLNSFIYTEYNQPPYSGIYEDDGAMRLLIGPFARILRWMVDDYRNGILTATEQTWFRPQYYRNFIIHHLSNAKTVNHPLQSLGFYGYELFMKLILWAHAEAIESLDLSDLPATVTAVPP